MLFPIRSSRGCCLLLHPPLLLTVFLPFPRCRGCSISRLLMPFLHSGLLHNLFSYVPPFGLFGETSSLFCTLRFCPAQRVIFLPAVVTSFRGSRFPLVQDFLKMFLLRHATVAWRDTFLQAAANFFRDPQSPRVSSFGSPRHPAACFQPLCRLFRPLTGFTTAY
jgi:hypothetical protein